MATFPHVVVNVSELYSDNNGAYEVSTLWDGEKLSFDSTMTQDEQFAIVERKRIIREAMNIVSDTAREQANRHTAVKERVLKHLLKLWQVKGMTITDKTCTAHFICSGINRYTKAYGFVQSV